MKRDFRLFLSTAAMLLATAGPVSAHEVWIERDGMGPARLYLQEIDAVVEESDETHRLQPSVVFVADPARPASLTRKKDHFEAAIAGKGDVRLHNDSVFAPWTGDGVRQGQVFHARAGRSETTAKLDFELVPVSSGGDAFTLLFRGKPVAASPVTVFSPARWKKAVLTDAAGRFTVPDAGKGRYILVATTSEDVARKMSGEDVARVNHMTTISYSKD